MDQCFGVRFLLEEGLEKQTQDKQKQKTKKTNKVIATLSLHTIKAVSIDGTFPQTHKTNENICI